MIKKKKFKIKKGDVVVVIAGKDKGKRGSVTEVISKTNRVRVSGVNISKVHTKPKTAADYGKILDKEMPLHISNVALVDPKLDVGAKIGYKYVAEEGKSVKLRYFKKSGEIV